MDTVLDQELTMFPNSYFAGQYFSDSYFPPTVDVEIPLPGPRGGGGSGPSVGRDSHFNQAPPKYRDPFIDQALMEDEELIILLKAFAEVIQWH